jgi:ribosomal protein S12 methylthiotransferase accessory factor
VTEPELPFTATAVTRTSNGGHLNHIHYELASGKGVSRSQAMLGAVGEAVERYSASVYDPRRLLRAKLHDLPGPALDPRQLSLYSEQQYESRGFPFARFLPDRVLDWVQGRWLDSDEEVWIPALPVFYNFQAPPEELFCQVTSNGLAAGPSLSDATRSAFLELIERDAFMLTWICRKPASPIELDTCDGPTLEITRQLRERGTDPRFFLLQTDASLFCVMAVAFGDGQDWPGAVVSLSATLNPAEAIRKAALELGHVAPYIRRLMREGKAPSKQPEEVASLLDHALYYVPPERKGSFSFLQGDPVSAAQLNSRPQPEFAACLEALRAKDVRIAVVDVTSPDLAAQPFRVVRALGINIQQIHFGHRLTRWGNPRLLAQKTFSGFNPLPHPLA